MSRWGRLGVVLLIVAASAACVGLGYWQLTRHNARAAQIALINANLDAEVVPIEDLLGPDLTAGLDPDDVWRPVEVTGTWVAGSGVQLRNRPVDAANASHALGLLRTDAGALLVVDRGWWRQIDVIPDGALDLPEGEVTLVVRLRADESGDERNPPLGQVYWIVPDDVVSQGFDGDAPAEVTGAPLVTDAYGIQEAPSPEDPLSKLPDPDASFGSNLSYAFQWWFFALAIPVAGVILARRARRTRRPRRPRSRSRHPWGPTAKRPTAPHPAGLETSPPQGTPPPTQPPSPARPAATIPNPELPTAAIPTAPPTPPPPSPPRSPQAAGTPPPGRATGRTPARSGGLRRRRPTLEEEEDALLDAQDRP